MAWLLAEAPFRWWIGGGRALELLVGERCRVSATSILGLCRFQVRHLHGWLDGWARWISAAGRFSAGSEH